MKRCALSRTRILLLFGLAGVASIVQAETDGLYDLSARLNIVGATGRPSNDIPGFGVIVHRKLTDQQYLGISYENATDYDIEGPYDKLKIASDREVDALATMHMITIVAEKRFDLERENWTGFWGLGGGIAEIGIDNAAGDVAGGGTYDIELEADTELVLLGSLGLLQRLDDRWSARYEIAVEHHLADWRIEDRVTGRTGSYDDYTVSGVRIGLNYRF